MIRLFRNCVIVIFLFFHMSNLQAGESRSGVVGYEPNSIVLTKRDDSDLDSSYRARLSFKYEFSRFLGFKPTSDKRLHFTYNGEFDFYWGFRDSSPVTGRVFNPALHYRFYKDSGEKKWKVDYVELSFHHRSNGQQTDPELVENGEFIAAREFALGNNAYIDGISRSANYLQVESRFSPSKNQRLYLRLRQYVGEQENTVTWRGPQFDADYSDYDRIELIYSYKFTNELRASFDWSIGDSGFASDSIDIGLQWDYGLPWYFRAHFGPMETLSDHTRSVNSVGVGFIFWKI